MPSDRENLPPSVSSQPADAQAEEKPIAAAIRAARRRGNMVSALEAASAAAKDHPRSAPVLLELARTQAALGQTEAAAATYHAILAFSPRNGNALAGLGRLAEDTDNLPEAETYLSRALIHRPNDAPLRHAAGHLQRVFGRFAQAAETLEPFLARTDAPQSLRLAALADLLQAALASGKTAKARAAAVAIIGLNPAHTAALSALAQIAAQRGNAAAAQRWCRRALASNPRNGELRQAHARSLAALAHSKPDQS